MILLWLLPAALATLAAMVLVTWIGRERPERERTDAQQERFAEAIRRPLPPQARPRPARQPAPEDRSGVAVHPPTRRSA